ncbi:PREDICTED: uncharacterized protein LOC104720395 [Camelina sativa]|uniref:Uncharacterized protein LOC104720395 n=1 Tax=Camelina sativa TaxID=90675 RepID=A0ABM0U6F1_CAMSA|nr:PREDICTED: uncharacterized protein LOC104720395 [Camelina sativa]
MAQLLINRIFKPSVCKNFLRHTNVRMFSSTTHFSSTPAYPFLLIDYILNIADSSLDGRVTTQNYSSKGKKVYINDEKLSEEVCDAMTVGFSRDGLELELESYISYSDDEELIINYNPSNPKLEDVTVHLPSLPTDTEIQNLVMSSLPVRDKDWVVGVKLSGSRLSLCRPFGSSKWININTMPQCINPFSTLMFSKTDQRFYIPSIGGNYLCYLDLNSKEDEKPKFIDMEFDNLPKSVYEELAEVSSCSRTEHLVESPTGQLFLVKWYGKDMKDYENDLIHVTEKFMVFRAGEESDEYGKTMIYTEDIGDLCIFVGRGEAYCVPASFSHGLKPNCIYFVGHNFGVYDLATKTCTTLYIEDYKPLRKLDFPYWPPPNN